MVVDRSGSEPRSPSSVSLADTDHARRWEGQLSKFTNVVKVVDLITSSDVNIDCQAQSNKLSCHFPPTLIFRSDQIIFTPTRKICTAVTRLDIC